jgi:serine/threonine-protein kinase RsbW
MLSEWSGRELVLAAGPHAPGLARRAIADRFRRHLDGAKLDDVQLVVSELVTNSCVHADVPTGRSIRLLATVGDGALRLEVRDSGLDGAVALRTPGGDGGFGLHIVEALATRWGIDHSDGTVVWCELPAGA